MHFCGKLQMKNKNIFKNKFSDISEAVQQTRRTAVWRKVSNYKKMEEKTEYDWLGKQVVFEVNRIKSPTIKRDTA